MSNQNLNFQRLIFTAAFAVVCIALGFYLATGFETPTRSVAQPSIIAPASTILFDEEGDSPFIAVAEKVKPVVVNITAEKEFSGRSTIPFDLFDWGPFFNQPPREQLQPKRPHITSGGSGIIYNTDGYILTNNHVVSASDKIMVKFTDGSELPAEVVGTDPETDVALIKVKSQIPVDRVAQFGNSDNIRIGEWAIAIGNPFGLDGTVTVGVISARGRSNLNIGGGEGPSFQNFIQTDASINFGNSGGPLVNIKGEVIGLNTAINAQGQGIGFAIPINLAHKVAEQLISSGEVKRGYLGVYPAELDEIKREALGIGAEIEGVFIESVAEQTPASEGGLKGGEVVTAIEGTPVKNVTEFRFKIADYPPNSKVRMTVWKNDKIRELEFKLGDRGKYLQTSGDGKLIPKPDIWLGIEVGPTDGKLGERYGLEKMKGALVVRIEPDSPADGLLQPGDVIIEIGGYEINSPGDFRKAAEELKDRQKAIPFWIMREGRRVFIPIRPTEE